MSGTPVRGMAWPRAGPPVLRPQQGVEGMAAQTGEVIQTSADREFHEQILEHLADGVYFVRRDRTITYWNRGAERLTGYRAADVIGRRCSDNILCHVDADGVDLCEGRCPLVAAVGDGADHEIEAWLRHADGSRRPVRVRTSPIRDDAGRVIGAVEVFDDASDLMAARRQAAAAQRDALVDELTHLPNWRFLDMMLKARIEDLERYATPFAVLMGDVDHFKQVNDRFGHATGDEALRVVVATLKARCARAISSRDGVVRSSSFWRSTRAAAPPCGSQSACGCWWRARRSRRRTGRSR